MTRPPAFRLPPTNPVPLFLFFGHGDYVIARDAAEASVFWMDHFSEISYAREFEKIPGDEEVEIFIDSDDTWYPHHLETHWRLLQESGADVAYSWFDGNLPFPESTHRGRVWDPAAPHHTTMTITVRTELAKRVGFALDHPEGWILAQEDWRLIVGLNEIGAKFIGTAETTWTYRVHGGNTSGMAGRGDAPR